MKQKKKRKEKGKEHDIIDSILKDSLLKKRNKKFHTQKKLN